MTQVKPVRNSVNNGMATIMFNGMKNGMII